MALRLAESHAAVVITYRSSKDSAEETVRRIESRGGASACIECDLTDPGAGVAAVHGAMKMFGHIDTLVNNAGGAPRRALMDLSLSEWSAALDLNLTSSFATISAAIPCMKERGGGSIVLIGSPAASQGGYVGAHYSAAKAGLRGLTAQAARELTAYGIRTNLVEPGGIRTDMVTDILAKDPEMSFGTRAGRFGEADEVASVVAFLCSGEASFVSGARVTVAGGGL